MKLRDLEMFVDVVEAGGMTQAAALRGGTQPGVSRAIRELEHQLGAPLFHRTGRGVALTEAGRRFLAFAESTLREQAEMRAEIRALTAQPEPELAIATPLRTGRFLIPALHKRFAAEAPSLNVHIYEERSSRIAEGLRARVYGAGLLYDHDLDAEASSEALFRERLHLVGPKRVVDAAAVAPKPGASAPISLAEAARLPLLLPGAQSGFRRRVDAAFAQARLTPQVVRELETAEAVLAFAMEGEGATILPFSNVFRECAEGAVGARPLIDPPIERDLHLAVGADIDRRTARAASALIRRVLSAVAGEVDWRAIPRA